MKVLIVYSDAESESLIDTVSGGALEAHERGFWEGDVGPFNSMFIVRGDEVCDEDDNPDLGQSYDDLVDQIYEEYVDGQGDDVEFEISFLIGPNEAFASYQKEKSSGRFPSVTAVQFFLARLHPLNIN